MNLENAWLFKNILAKLELIRAINNTEILLEPGLLGLCSMKLAENFFAPSRKRRSVLLLAMTEDEKKIPYRGV